MAKKKERKVPETILVLDAGNDTESGILHQKDFGPDELEQFDGEAVWEYKLVRKGILKFRAANLDFREEKK